MATLTRLTNGFSKEWENHWAALCLHFAYHNFCRIHRSIRVTRNAGRHHGSRLGYRGTVSLIWCAVGLYRSALPWWVLY
jgi:hypothetical protein